MIHVRPNTSRRNQILLAELVAAMSTGVATAQSTTESDPAAAQPGPTITFTSWTGPYMRSQMLGFVR
ncbi:MAG: hypothetical protein AAF408_19680, partial [Pseudomonadota bacterium]